MGCNQTKAEDIQASTRERVRADSPGGPTRSTPITSPAKAGTLDDSALGKSYSEKRVMESEELLNNIIEHAERDLIDVGTTTTMDGGVSERGGRSAAEELVKTVKVPAGAFALPTSSQSSTDVLKKDVPEFEFVDVLAGQVSGAMEGLVVQECGELVVGFGTPI